MDRLLNKPDIKFSTAYGNKLTEIENFIWTSTLENFDSVQEFLTDHDNVLDFLKENPNTPAIHPKTGDQS